MVVLVAAHETGSANALVPVIRTLAEQAQVQVQVLATAYAPRLFREERIPHREIRLPEATPAQLLQHADQFLEDCKPDLLILGTAWEKNLEKALLKKATARGIRTLAMVDNWSYFRERFLGLDNQNLVFPDKVAVVDEAARRQALQEGIPPERMVITGQPHLESLPKKAGQPAVRNQADRLRRQWLAASAGETAHRLILFVSEPLSTYSGPTSPYYRGYTEVDALKGVLQAAEVVGQRRGLRTRVVAKLHPREELASSPLVAWAASQKVRIEKEIPPLASFLASDAVVGMASMALLEAACVGRPAASFEPTGKEKMAFHGSRIGAVAKAGSVPELAQWLETTLIQPPPPPPQALSDLIRPAAARRVVKVAMELVG